MHGVFVTSGVGEREDVGDLGEYGDFKTVRIRVGDGQLPGPGVRTINVNESFVPPSPGFSRVSPFAPRCLGDDGRR